MMDGSSSEKDNQKTTVDSKYIQQHLANERTFLAWIRTAIAIIGVGFLVTNLHFNMRSTLSPMGDFFANTIGISSVALGIVVIIMATTAYLKKVESINTQTFKTPKLSIIGLALFVIMIAIVFGIYFIMVNA